MSSDPLSLPPPPHRRVVVGCGSVSLDFLAAVASYPSPDDKIRTTDLKVQGGGNAGNALTCAARLGLKPRLISKVADDTQGRGMLEELEADGVDTSFFVVSPDGNSPFTYVIVDNKTKTRTCILTPGHPPLLPHELPLSSLTSALDEARIVFFDGRFPETALKIAREAAAMHIPILVEAERLREGLDDLLMVAEYAVCSAKFPKAWTNGASIVRALLSMMLRLPNLQFVIVTMGEDGCIMLERSVDDDSDSGEVDVDSLLDSLRLKRPNYTSLPTCTFSPKMKLTAKEIGTVSGRLYLGTAENIPPSELVDTTGAGDAFIGATLYALCAGMPPEKMLRFAAQVAAANCRALGARTGLPHRTDRGLTPYLQ
ncbi:ribokinase-like [Rhodamnia argentea]|uniref:Ribokinase-like n=1 Tax=Rhodamnia argentea TaxID=178133 RepID=A0A8B8PD38_9MYRT|nr:ribokinase-like [Rhodamnia argentea]